MDVYRQPSTTGGEHLHGRLVNSHKGVLCPYNVIKYHLYRYVSSPVPKKILNVKCSTTLQTRIDILQNLANTVESDSVFVSPPQQPWTNYTDHC